MQPIAERRSDGISREYRVNIGQGTTYVTDNAEAILTTVLGSCVACCLFDPIKRIGGMNHFLLPMPHADMARDSAEAERYGLLAMELLINGMLKQGSSRGDMRAHLYGGANMHRGMQSIGTNNANFALKFLKDDGIALSHSHMGGAAARRIDFRAALGQARCRVVLDTIPVEITPTLSAMKKNDAEFF